MATTFETIETRTFARGTSETPMCLYRGLAFHPRELAEEEPPMDNREVFYRGAFFHAATPNTERKKAAPRRQFYRGTFFDA